MTSAEAVAAVGSCHVPPADGELSINALEGSAGYDVGAIMVSKLCKEEKNDAEVFSHPIPSSRTFSPSPFSFHSPTLLLSPFSVLLSR